MNRSNQSHGRRQPQPGMRRYASAAALCIAAGPVVAQISCGGEPGGTADPGSAAVTPLAMLDSGALTASLVAADTAGVRAAVLDYVEAIYRSEPVRIQRSVDPALTKLGHARRSASEEYSLVSMTYEQLLNLARTWNDDGEVDPDRARREVIVHEVLDRTASAKLVAEWGVDLLQLHRVNGRWRIVHVLWQTFPADDFDEGRPAG